MPLNLRTTIIASALFFVAPVYAACEEPMVSAISLEYDVNDESMGLTKSAPGRPEDVRGPEKRYLVLTDDQSYERTTGRFWRPDKEAMHKKMEELLQKAQAGEFESFPQEEYRVEIEDKIVITTPNRYIHYDNVTKKGFERPRNNLEELLSGSDAREAIKILSEGVLGERLGDAAKQSDARYVGKKVIAGKECQLVTASVPFKVELCSFQYGIHTVVLQEKVMVFGYSVTEQVTKLDLNSCVSPQLFSAPDVPLESRGG
ncbi:MAG: hypothetical protein COB00_05025 [Alcanivorax sp.]|nr:MAG: hypothetical protein COB00_05025 [Alcanivorax sp.]